jgi:hypothetical protein
VFAGIKPTNQAHTSLAAVSSRILIPAIDEGLCLLVLSSDYRPNFAVRPASDDPCKILEADFSSCAMRRDETFWNALCWGRSFSLQPTAAENGPEDT